ncbi:Uncharacterised protein [Serratia fonticola]|uniref:Uncharacterized protein n=1 Tax=Serratia fonticola TaxID=47917 RepID=A0A4U9U438_SERFO|nr:Uncharacterised protein [Serratia fonticola]
MTIIKIRYPGAIAWPFGDSAEMADELADLVIKGVKTATCCSLSSFKNEEEITNDRRLQHYP